MPLTLTTTDLVPPRARDERFLGGALVVRSRSGLHHTESFLLERLSTLTPAPARVVVAGNRTGVLPATLHLLFPQAAVVAHTTDAHHSATIRRTLSGSGIMAGITCVPAAEIVAESDEHLFDAAVLQLSRNAMPAERMQDLLQNVHETLRDGGTCLIAFEGDAEWLRNQLKTIFGKTAVTVTDGISFAHALRTRPLSKPKNFAATFDVTLPGVAPFTLMTRPGIFSHRRADQGGLALAEVAAREVTATDRVLDIGCGCGIVGIALARACPGIHVTFVDSDARAVACAEANARTNELADFAVVCSDRGINKTGFTLAVGNPPYFGNYTIAELFIRNAYDALAPGGRCLIVSKQSRWHEAFMAEQFGNAEPIRRRDYTVVQSSKTRDRGTRN